METVLSHRRYTRTSHQSRVSQVPGFAVGLIRWLCVYVLSLGGIRMRPTQRNTDMSPILVSVCYVEPIKNRLYRSLQAMVV